MLTNEVPDAFGVHKVVLSADGQARAALVVPRVEPALRDAVGAALSRRIAEADGAVRAAFGLARAPRRPLSRRGHLGGGDGGARGAARRERETRCSTSALWFEEAYVPASAVPELAAHLAAGAAEYAIALAAEDSGVVTYVNVHAGRFIREIGASLAAGFVVTIDYGDTTWGLIEGARRGEFPFRVYGDRAALRPEAQRSLLLARIAGHDGGRELHRPGPRRPGRRPPGDPLRPRARPGRRRAAGGCSRPPPTDESLAEFLGNPVFKLLVLGTRASDVFAGPLLSPLPLERREQDVPKARRARIASIRDNLSRSAGADP